MKIGDFGLAYDLDNHTRQKRMQTLTSSSSKPNNLDVTSGNIMEYSIIKIDEFVGTPLYQSPEQIKEHSYNEKVDIYAMGLILYEMCGCFKTGMERRINIEKLRNETVLSKNVYEKYPVESELILLMTRLKPSERPSANEILNCQKFRDWKKRFSD